MKSKQNFRKKLTDEELQAVNIAVEDTFYTCGAQMFAEHEQPFLVYVETKVSIESCNTF